MVVPITTAHDVKDRNGRAVTAGSKVRVAGQPEPVEAQQVDARYGTVIVLVPGRAGQRMGLMVHSADVELAS